jgi:predicted dehydrogenase
LKISTAIIGLGKIGLTYDFDKFGKLIPNQIMTHCRSVSTSNFFKVSYLIDPQSECVDMALRHYGGIGFSSLEPAEGQDPPQLVIVSVPTPLHLEVLLKVTKKWKPSTYLIEKPFGSSLEEALQMQDILQSQGAKVYVNYFRRYLPNFISLKSHHLFQNRGKLHSVTINGYGSLKNIFSHFLDLLIFLEPSCIEVLSKKYQTSTEKGNLSFEDLDSEIRFKFSGVGFGARECEMTLVYENLFINVTSNGRCIEISNKQQDSVKVFNLDENVFNSYQSTVLEKIAVDFTFRENNTSVEDAIHIHRFLEGI